MEAKRTILRRPFLDNQAKVLFEKYVSGYVHRINASTFNLDLKEVSLDIESVEQNVSIDEASKAIKFSIFAFDSMPKRLTRFHVIANLARFITDENSEQYWQIVSKFEPNCKTMKRQFDICFTRNVKEALLGCGEVSVSTSVWNRPRIPRILVGKTNTRYTDEIASHCSELLENSELNSVGTVSQNEAVSNFAGNTANGVATISK